MSKILEWIKSLSLIPVNISVKIIFSLVAIIIVWLSRKIFLVIAFRKITEPKKRYNWKKVSGRIALILYLLIFIVGIWFEIFNSILTLLGLVSAGIVIALKDLFMAIAGWIYITLRKPFSVGDRIQIGDKSGDVIDIKAFQFTLIEIGNWVDADQSTGRLVFIPCDKVFKEDIVNYNKAFNFIWNEIAVLITFESNWKKAKKILNRMINKEYSQISEEAEKKLKVASKDFLIFYTKLTPKIYTKVINSGVLLTIRYLCKPQQRRNTEEIIWEKILDKFSKNSNINFAYQTERVVLSDENEDPPAKKDK